MDGSLLLAMIAQEEYEHEQREVQQLVVKGTKKDPQEDDVIWNSH